jgi:hypothetical protein
VIGRNPKADCMTTHEFVVFLKNALTMSKVRTPCLAWIAAARTQCSSVAQRWKSSSETLGFL